MRGARTAIMALGAATLMLCRCVPDSDAICHHEGEDIFADERIDGTRAGDVLEPYFGDYHGTLSWTAGGDTALTLQVPHETGAPYVLNNVSQCEARDISYWSHAHVSTEDRALDNEVFVGLYRNLPSAGAGAIPASVASFATIADFQWQPTLPDRLGVDVSRYSSSSVHFELDWPPSAVAPGGGRLLLRGTLARDSKTQDTVLVATLRF